MQSKKFVVICMIISITFFSCKMTINSPKQYSAQITNVYDGKTVELRFYSDMIDGIAYDIPEGCNKTEIAKLMGVDSPDITLPLEYYAAQSYQYTKNALYGKRLIIEFDTIKRDSNGTLLVYVKVNFPTQYFLATQKADGYYLFNELILISGNAYFDGIIDYNKNYKTDFELAQNEAKLYKRGLWN